MMLSSLHKYLFLWVWIVLNITIGACSSSNSSQKETPRIIDFSQYSTFYFPDAVVPSSDNPVFKELQLSERVEQEISFILSAKNLDRTSQNGDLAVYYYAITQHEENGLVLPYRIGWAAEPFIESGEILENYSADTFVIDVVDPNMNQLIWRGSIGLPFQNSDKLFRVLSDSLQKLLKPYPRLPN